MDRAARRIVIPFILASMSFSYLEHVFLFCLLLEYMERTAIPLRKEFIFIQGQTTSPLPVCIYLVGLKCN